MKRAIIQKGIYATIALGAVSLIVGLCGCNTEKLPDFHPDATATTVQIKREAGMEIALEPFFDPQRTRQFFGINAVAEGVGIMFVRISNNTSNQIFLVEKKNFQFLLPGVFSGQNPDTNTSERVNARYQQNSANRLAMQNAWADAVMTAERNAQISTRFQPGMGQPSPMENASMALAGADIVTFLFEFSRFSHSTEVQRNFVDKEMPDQTLAPGQSMDGFLYYVIAPKNRKWASGGMMKVDMTETKSRESISMIIPLSP